MKKLTLIVLLAFCATAVFASGSAPGTIGEELTITCLKVQNPVAEELMWAKEHYMDLLKEKFNIVFDYTEIEVSELADRLTVMFNTGTETEYFDSMRPSEAKLYGADGLLYNFYPEMNAGRFAAYKKNFIGDVELAIKQVRTSVNELHIMVGPIDGAYGYTLIYDKNRLDEAGVEWPKDLAGLRDVLAKCKKNDPDAVLMSLWSDSLWSFMEPWMKGFRTQQNFYYNPDIDAVEFGAISDNMRKALIYQSDLYTNGLVDQELFTPDMGPNWVTKLFAGEVYIMMTWGWGASPGIGLNDLPTKDEVPMNWVWDRGLTLPADASDNRPVWTLYRGSATGHGQAISVDTDEEKTERLLDYIAWQGTDEGMMVTNWGFEGITYNMVNGQPQYNYPEFFIHSFGRTSPLTEGGPRPSSIMTMLYLPRETLLRDPRVVLDYGGPYMAELINHVTNMVENGEAALVMSSYPFALTDSQVQSINEKLPDIETLRDEWCAQFAVGRLDASDDAVWYEYVSALKKLGVDELLEIYQSAYDLDR